MTNQHKQVDRRNHPRHKARQGAFAVLPAEFKLGQIEDISQGGLAFCYVPLDDPEGGSEELEIYFTTDGFYLKKVPFETVLDVSIEDNLPFNYVERRRHHLKFGNLSPFQRIQLSYFIENYTE